MKCTFVRDTECLLSYCTHVTARNKNTIGVAGEDARSGIFRRRSPAKDDSFAEVYCNRSWRCLLTLLQIR